MQYMAPEQLEGAEADARTDIFAFGVALYEMITGRKAFEGKSQPHLIAAILSVEPDPVSKLQPKSPPALDFLVKRCLTKDPEQRLQSATDLVWELHWIAEGGTQTGVARSDGGRPAPSHELCNWASRPRRWPSPSRRTGVAVWPQRAPREATRFLIPVAEMPMAEAAVDFPDGKTIAYSAREAAATAVFVRPIDKEVPQKLAGTEGAGRLFWSPDSRWIGFFAGGKLKKVEAAGGPPQNLCETPDLAGATWNAAGDILFASSKGLQRVTAAGGEPATVAAASDGRQEPSFYRTAVITLRRRRVSRRDLRRLHRRRRFDSTGRGAIECRVRRPRYVLYHREGTLYAQPFNPKKLTLSGEPIRVADRIPHGVKGAAAFAASHTGILLYRNDPPSASTPSGTAANATSVPLLWIGRTGSKVEDAGGVGTWTGVDLSPDGKRAAAHRHEAEGGDIWIFEAGNRRRRSSPSTQASTTRRPSGRPTANASRSARGEAANGACTSRMRTTRAARNSCWNRSAQHADELVRGDDWCTGRAIPSRPATSGALRGL